MARIAGVELKGQDRVEYALTNVFGIGWSLAGKILATARIDPLKRVEFLTDDETLSLARIVEEYETEGDLRARIRTNIQRLKDINSYRGSRHAHNLPARGQRTRTNARTKRGKRKTVGAFKKETLAKARQREVQESKKQ